MGAFSSDAQDFRGALMRTYWREGALFPIGIFLLVIFLLMSFVQLGRWSVGASHVDQRIEQAWLEGHSQGMLDQVAKETAAKKAADAMQEAESTLWYAGEEAKAKEQGLAFPRQYFAKEDLKEAEEDLKKAEADLKKAEARLRDAVADAVKCGVPGIKTPEEQPPLKRPEVKKLKR